MYANEADVLNVALLGVTAKQWRDANPDLKGNMRDYASLDKFDKLVNDISVGLPAEIQARRKQYEYYRGKLLTFKCLNR